MAALVTKSRIRETSATTGTGTYTLAGAVTGFRTFVSQIGANNYCRYYATNGVDYEGGWGTVLDSPARLVRTHIAFSSNGGAAVEWPASPTLNLRCAQLGEFDQPRVLSKDVAGGAGDTTLTIDEQRRDVLIFTGALTGNRTIIVDNTAWHWPAVVNNTSGAYTLTVKVSGQTGVAVQQGKSRALYCDGTDVEDADTDRGSVVDVYTTPGANTWTKRPGAVEVEPFLVAAGGGGGSGRRGAGGEIRYGGSGGGGGAWARAVFSASLLGSTETVTVGAKGTGGAAQTVNSTDGNDGTNGGSTTFGTWLSAPGGQGGEGGGTSGPDGGAGGGNTQSKLSPTEDVAPVEVGRHGGVDSSDLTRGTPHHSKGYGAPGGGVGGKIDPPSTVKVPTAGGSVLGPAVGSAGGFAGATLAGGAAGASGAAGGNGIDATANAPKPGSAGGGGGAHATNAGGAGGNGGKYGAGGGGGAGSTNGANSGAGGDGADGIAVVITRF